MEKKSKVIVVSNRLPVTIAVKDDQFQVEKSVGGLATGLQSMLEQKACVWVGWPGKISQLTADQQKEVMSKLNTLSLAPVLLSDKEVKNYYEDYSNGVLWPLFHSLTGELPMVFSGFEEYVKVNEKFAEAVAAIYEEGDVVWVHDLHLMLLPSFLRTLKPKAKIGFFLHIPFPTAEIFRILPHKEAILQGLLAADLIGFHTPAYLRNFTLCVLRVLGLGTEMGKITYQYRQCSLGVFPMGIDDKKFEILATQPDTINLAKKYKGKDDCTILLGIDRLDYTKGLPRRLQAFELMLERYPEYIGKVRLIQVSVPSRLDVEAYKEYRKRVEALVARIQGRFSTPDWTPIHYLFRSFQTDEIVALYRAADVMLVTPVRDGMNLVAKEYVASRVDNQGVLVLSEFAGAAHELGNSLLVNPYDTKNMAEVLHEAIQMPSEEKEQRMSKMRKLVQSSNIDHWIEQFLDKLVTEAEATSLTNFTPNAPETIVDRIKGLHKQIINTRNQEFKFPFRKSGVNPPQIVLFLDYDGTLVNFADTPEKAGPPEEVITLLTDITNVPFISLHLVSGRDRETLVKWFGHLRIHLHAEHGIYSRMANSKWSVNAHENEQTIVTPWRESITQVFKEFSKNIPGTFVEEKEFTVAWHYRQAKEQDFTAEQANELKLHLLLFANSPFSVLYGNKVIEVCPVGLNKGLVVKKITKMVESSYNTSETIYIAVGDDQTDEFMFGAMPPDGISVHVGLKNFTSAKFRLEGVEGVRKLLKLIMNFPRTN